MCAACMPWQRQVQALPARVFLPAACHPTPSACLAAGLCSHVCLPAAAVPLARSLTACMCKEMAPRSGGMLALPVNERAAAMSQAACWLHREGPQISMTRCVSMRFDTESQILVEKLGVVLSGLPAHSTHSQVRKLVLRRAVCMQMCKPPQSSMQTSATNSAASQPRTHSSSLCAGCPNHDACMWRHALMHARPNPPPPLHGRAEANSNAPADDHAGIQRLSRDACALVQAPAGAKNVGAVKIKRQCAVSRQRRGMHDHGNHISTTT